MIESAFAQSLLAGLAKDQKTLEPKFFYDDVGSALFEEITRLEAYYPTRTELGVLTAEAPAMAAAIGPGAVLAEPGAGAPTKAEILLAAMDRPAAYAPGDISIDHLAAATEPLRQRFPGLRIAPFALDFDKAFDLPADVAALGPVTLFFPGSTIGNFSPEGARQLLGRFAGVANAHMLLIGVDLKKDVKRLERAYDDPEGVTARFNLNILARANRELGADFDLERFRHLAVYNPTAGRIEMHLESAQDQSVRVLGQTFRFRAGERIHTENSYKYDIADFQALAASAGWQGASVWTDPNRWFAEMLFTR